MNLVSLAVLIGLLRIVNSFQQQKITFVIFQGSLSEQIYRYAARTLLRVIIINALCNINFGTKRVKS